jgi:hypothetical protein
MTEPIRLRAGRTTTDPRLDRIPLHDPLSRNYQIRSLLDDGADLRGAAGRYWSACPIQPDPVNKYGGTAVLTAGMLGIKKGWWREIRWIGAGSGRLEDDIIDTLRTVGGIVFGIPWLSGMYETSPSGLVQVDGSVVGGHAIHGWEWAPRQRMAAHWTGTKPGVWWHNSWGPQAPATTGGYGVTRRGKPGCGFVPLDDLLRLLTWDGYGGEGMVPLS